MAERLTHREGEHTVRIGNEWRRHDPVWDKLAQYEDLGFTPEEVALLAKFYKEHASVSAIIANMKLVANSIKWEEYEKLKEQGRLIELPCVPNETVWCADEYNTRPVLYGSKSSILYDIECAKGIGYTKEEAEEKLKERGEQK